MSNPSILVLGGTRFIGRVLVEQLIERGYSNITLFNRGITNPELFPQLTHLQGDRETENGTDPIVGKDWDIVFDLSAMYPNTLEKLATKLAGKVGRYVFISTVSVYDFEHGNGSYHERSPVLNCTADQATDHSMKTYGNRKAECERRLFATEDLDVVALRPSLVFGPHDYTDRLYYWLYRIMHSPHILLPDGGMHFSNYTYVKDLAAFAIAAGFAIAPRMVYNLSTYEPVRMIDLLNRTATLFDKHPIWTNVSSKWLDRHNISRGGDIPLFFGLDLKIDNHRAVKDYEGNFASLEQALSKTVDWYADGGWQVPKAGMTLEKERETLEMLANEKE